MDKGSESQAHSDVYSSSRYNAQTRNQSFSRMGVYLVAMMNQQLRNIFPKIIMNMDGYDKPVVSSHGIEALTEELDHS